MDPLGGMLLPPQQFMASLDAATFAVKGDLPSHPSSPPTGSKHFQFPLNRGSPQSLESRQRRFCFSCFLLVSSGRAAEDSEWGSARVAAGRDGETRCCWLGWQQGVGLGGLGCSPPCQHAGMAQDSAWSSSQGRKVSTQQAAGASACVSTCVNRGQALAFIHPLCLSPHHSCH